MRNTSLRAALEHMHQPLGLPAPAGEWTIRSDQPRAAMGASGKVVGTMGVQDRDWYWKKYDELTKGKPLPRVPSQPTEFARHMRQLERQKQGRRVRAVVATLAALLVLALLLRYLWPR